jgi:SAM-dependent methyltransferase
LVGLSLFAERRPVTEWPVRPDIVGYGVSDWSGFSKYYHFTYTNTQFDHQLGDQPFLDITRPPTEWIETADLVSCSDVLEHVPPPVDLAFKGMFRLLKPGGTLVLTVPYTFLETVEHFPELDNWELLDGNRILRNVTREGKIEVFSGLCFHGGGQAVLEMRLFGLDGLREQLLRAGFEDVGIMDYDVLQYGIRYGSAAGRPIVARRPVAGKHAPRNAILATDIERALALHRV